MEMKFSIIYVYFDLIVHRRSPLSTESDRKKAGEKITRDGHDLKNYFEEKMKVKSEVSRFMLINI